MDRLSSVDRKKEYNIYERRLGFDIIDDFTWTLMLLDVILCPADEKSVDIAKIADVDLLDKMLCKFFKVDYEG